MRGQDVQQPVENAPAETPAEPQSVTPEPAAQAVAIEPELDVSQFAKLDEELAETGMVPSGYRFRPHGTPRWEKIAKADTGVPG